MPLALDEWATDLACRSARTNVSTELKSGLGAPARTATPIPERARSTRLPDATKPRSINLSSASPAMITRSTGSPAAKRPGMEVGAPATELPHAVSTLRPLAFSKPGTSARYAALKPPDANTLISPMDAILGPPASNRCHQTRRCSGTIRRYRYHPQACPEDPASRNHRPDGAYNRRGNNYAHSPRLKHHPL